MGPLNKYFTLRSNKDLAYGRFDANPTKKNSDAYGLALSEYQDYCVEIVEKMISVAPGLLHMIDKLQVGE